jgi:hypothetical protein
MLSIARLVCRTCGPPQRPMVCPRRLKRSTRNQGQIVVLVTLDDRGCWVISRPRSAAAVRGVDLRMKDSKVITTMASCISQLGMQFEPDFHPNCHFILTDMQMPLLLQHWFVQRCAAARPTCNEHGRWQGSPLSR